ncbi:hypothetical protein SAMN05444279_12231 [Ruegeria intermedia]|uniref:Uncharacterized protein n=1 Tax=Ruegeria intermedia TaxID=996115 RepID=A0A1M4ZXE4_9RHOB|nr:hypothetical protein [Ruegeria intermedia]SHF22691.1 hypothetical protein SAMN05444279_12231 [Ruegeria intermedia]
MKPLPVLFLVALAAGCTNIPELQGREAAAVTDAPYPRLIPLDEALGPPVDVVSEAADLSKNLTERKKSLRQRANRLQNTPID